MVIGITTVLEDRDVDVLQSVAGTRLEMVFKNSKMNLGI